MSSSLSADNKQKHISNSSISASSTSSDYTSSSSTAAASSSSAQAAMVAMMITTSNNSNVPITTAAVDDVDVLLPVAVVRRGPQQQIPRAMSHDNCCLSVVSGRGQLGKCGGQLGPNYVQTSSSSIRFFNRLIVPTLLLLTFLAYCAHTVHAAPIAGYSRTMHVPVGAVFTLDVGDDPAASPSPDGFPGWARLNDSSNQVYGIPQANNVGVYTIPMKDRTVRIEVGNELKQRCEDEIKTTWLEIVDEQRINELPVENQFNSVKSLLAKLNVRLSDVRLFPFNYLDKYRTVTEIMKELEQYQHQQQQKIHDDQIVYTVNISCGELNDQSSDVISAAIENGLSLQVVQGILVNLHQPTDHLPTDENGGSDQKTESANKNGQKVADTTDAAPTSSKVPLIILALILAALILIGVFWALIKRAKAGQEKQTDANGKTHGGTAHLPSPAGDSTTPMLGHKGNADRTPANDGMAPENGVAGRN